LGTRSVVTRLEGAELLVRELTHVGVAAAGQLLGLRDRLDDALVLAEPLDQRLDFCERLGVLAVFGRIPLHGGAAEQRHQLVVAGLDGAELVEHFVIHDVEESLRLFNFSTLRLRAP
jgi:hypothetical protein